MFSVIVGVLLVLVVAQTWLKEILQVRLREWLTHDLLDRWLAPKRAYLLAHAGEIGVNPDQRVHEDTRHLIDLSTDLAVRMLQASLLLISFIGVLWVLSAKVVFVAGDHSFTVPGYMVWCALAYAIGGSWLAWRVGRPLIPLNATRYAREADLRFSLVRVSECAEGIALYGGETDERRILEGTVDHVLTVMRRLAGGLARLTWVTSGYGWLAIIAPVLVAAPGYFGGSLSFGGLMMVIGAFNQVQQSLRWFVDDFHRVADWRATLLRVMALREALAAPDTANDGRERIELVDHAVGHIGLENLTVAVGGGQATLGDAMVEIAPGERVLIVGETGSDKSTLFRAMAGLWPWGTGTIHLPPRRSMMFMPQRPYLPLGSLRAAVSYPAEPGRFDDLAVGAALMRVGLGHLVPTLGHEQRWDKNLPLEEQQRLGFRPPVAASAALGADRRRHGRAGRGAAPADAVHLRPRACRGRGDQHRPQSRSQRLLLPRPALPPLVGGRRARASAPTSSGTARAGVRASGAVPGSWHGRIRLKPGARQGSVSATGWRAACCAAPGRMRSAAVRCGAPFPTDRADRRRPHDTALMLGRI